MDYNMEEMDFHDLCVSKINLDFVNDILELEVQFVDEITDEIISKKISFKNIKEIENRDFPTLSACCEINFFEKSPGKELEHRIEMVVLTGHGAPSWHYLFECSEIIW